MNKTEVYPAVAELGERARLASRSLASATTEAKDKALLEAAREIRRRSVKILKANGEDMNVAASKLKNAAFLDRLELSGERIEGIAKAVEAIAALPDPVGRNLAEFNRPNGLVIQRISVPIGVIAMIYEARPNVAADAGALCLKSGNAVILRGGSESVRSSAEIAECIQHGLRSQKLPADAVQCVCNPSRDAVTELLQCTEFIDLAIPRGGKGLVSVVKNMARVPTLLHLEGNCHTYVHEDADLDQAVDVVVNAKMRRVGICGATESLVVDRAVAGAFLPRLLDALCDCEVRGEAEAIALDPRIAEASESDWDEEYLSACLSVKIVDNLALALQFIETHSSGHTDAIITEDKAVAAQFFQRVDSAIVMHNASTQFADGGEFGFGAEIGIATGKLHARGPVGLEQLTTFKYLVHGAGQVRTP